MTGDIIRMLRRKKDVTQAYLAQRMGVTQQAVGKWEQNKAEPDIKTLVRLSSFFGVTMEELAGVASPTFAHTAAAHDTRTASILRELKARIDEAFDDALTALEAEDSVVTPEERRIYERVRRLDALRVKKESQTSDAG